MMRPGLVWSVAAAAVGVVSITGITMSASAVPDVVLLVCIIGLATFLLGLLVGSPAAIGFASLPVLLAGALEAIAVDESDWLRSVVIGCAWFVTAELGWEAIERRVGDDTTPAVTFRRLHEVGVVLGITLGIAVVAVAIFSQSIAPVRTLPVQAFVVFGFVAAFVAAVRRVSLVHGDRTTS